MSSEQEIHRVFKLQKEKQSQPASPWDLKTRLRLIKKLRDAMFAYREQIQTALVQDLHKAPAETDLSEIYVVLSQARYALKHLRLWMQPQRVKTPITLLGARSYIYQEPKGLALIISPWNFPINLSFSPLVAALASGNRVILKPSEHSPASSALMQEIIGKLYKPEEVSLFTGGAETAKSLLALPFDHIFFTGSSALGKQVMQAAAQNLSSVTLELGGKSPAIIDESANLEAAAARIAWAKFINSGQTCIAPDYVCVHEKKQSKFLDLLEKKVRCFYLQKKGKAGSIQASADYCRIVNAKHSQRLEALLQDALDRGAQKAWDTDEQSKAGEQNFIPPTVLSNVDLKSKLMQEEIFGPILPVIPFSSLEEAISLIQEKAKPLALYIYSKKRKNIKKVLSHTRAGGSCINDSLVHFFNMDLPFGGAGFSGMGKSHGHLGFQEFSNPRGILHQNLAWNSVRMLMPPYTKLKHKVITLTMRLF